MVRGAEAQAGLLVRRGSNGGCRYEMMGAEGGARTGWLWVST